MPQVVPAEVRENGACRGRLDLDFYSSDQREAKVCRDLCNTECPVRLKCLTYALSGPEWYGVWGGAAEWELRQALNLTKDGTVALEEPLPARCGNCHTARTVTVKRIARSRRDRATCSRCGLEWVRARTVKTRKAEAVQTDE